MPQTAYTRDMESGYPGLVTSIQPQDTISRNNLTEVQPFGLLVSQGAAASQCKLPSVSTDVTAGALGITRHEHVMPSSVNGAGQFEAYSDVSVLRRGSIWVTVENAVTPADPVFVRFANGAGGTQEGAFRTGADTATAAQLPSARFERSAGAGALVPVAINLP